MVLGVHRSYRLVVIPCSSNKEQTRVQQEGEQRARKEGVK
jgi:hypothetical protein